MRFDKKVFFVEEGERVRNNATGNYEVADEVSTMRYANVSDTGTERRQLLFGSIKVRSKTVRLQNEYKDAFDWIEIDGIKYQDTVDNQYRNKNVFIVSDVQ